MAKLTLTVDARVVSRAEQYAKSQGVSVSQTVETYLAALSESGFPDAVPAPILRSVRGILKDADIDEYHQYLSAKCR